MADVGHQRFTKIVSKFDQEIPQSQTADNLMAPRNHHETPEATMGTATDKHQTPTHRLKLY